MYILAQQNISLFSIKRHSIQLSLSTDKMQSLLFLLFVGICLNMVKDSDQRISNISSSVYQKLKNIKNITQFIDTFVSNSNKSVVISRLRMLNSPITLPVRQSGTKMSDGIQMTGGSQMSGAMAKNDVCNPKLSSVKVPQSDPSVLLWPTCTVLNQCAGCCGSSIFECTPTKKITLSLKVLKCRPTSQGSDDFAVEGFETLDFEEHQDCECQCKTKVTDCDLTKHVYLPHECRCRCKNEHEADKCKSPKRWDDITCSCVCTEVYHCHPEEKFSHSSCRCEMKKSQRSTASLTGNLNQGPCAGLKCRTGYKAVRNNGRCRCSRNPYM